MTMSLFAVGKTCRLIHGDSADVLRSLAPGSVDAVVADPPSSIGFMGAEWDSDRGGRGRWVQWLRRILKLALVALKPGGHALIWALPRRSHWTALAVETAGFEIRDVHHHIFGSGMPKSDAQLKPAVEHWILGRKPFRGSLEACIAEHGTGGLMVEACRVGTSKSVPASPATAPNQKYGDRPKNLGTSSGFDPNIGRWPAHLSLDEYGAAVLDEQSGILHARGNRNQSTGGGGKIAICGGPIVTSHHLRPELAGDGGASRFFYCAKPSAAERTASGQVDNDHETVKSIALMSWLVRLITPHGGTVLDPFAGSGTTGVACAAEGMSFIGVEQSSKHHETARQRLSLVYGDVKP